MVQGLGLWLEARSWCAMDKARIQGRLFAWRVQEEPGQGVGIEIS